MSVIGTMLVEMMALIGTQPAVLTPQTVIVPNAPRVAEIELERGIEPELRPARPGAPLRSAPAAGITFVNLPPGATIRLLHDSDQTPEERAQIRARTAATRCVLTGGLIHRSGSRVDAGGRVVYRTGLNVTLPDDGSTAGAQGPCYGAIVVEIVPTVGARDLSAPAVGRPLATPGGLTASPAAQRLVLDLPASMLPQWTRYRYTNTWALRRMFDFAMRGDPGSVCSGSSPGPTSYPVGPHNRGGDLTVQVRSGPAGTVCRAASAGIVMPADVRLVEIDWDVEKDGTACCASDECLERVGERGVIAPGHLPDDNPGPYQQATGQSDIARRIGVTPANPGRDQHVLGFAHAWLACGATAVNDHGVRIILRSATFEGPPGANMP